MDGEKILKKDIEKLKNRIDSQIKKSYPFTISDLAVNGHDVRKAVDLQPGPWIGKILDKLIEIVIQRPEHNQKHKLIKIFLKY